MIAEKEVRAFQRRQLLTEREQREMEEKAVWEETVELNYPSSDSSTEVDATDESDCESRTTPSAPKRSCWARMNIVTPQLTAALDRTDLTDQSAVHALSAAASALGHDASSKLVISSSSIRRSRQTQRKAIEDKIRSSYASSTSLIVYWDGKLLPDTGTSTLPFGMPPSYSGDCSRGSIY